MRKVGTSVKRQGRRRRRRRRSPISRRAATTELTRSPALSLVGRGYCVRVIAPLAALVFCSRRRRKKAVLMHATVRAGAMSVGRSAIARFVNFFSGLLQCGVPCSCSLARRKEGPERCGCLEGYSKSRSELLLHIASDACTTLFFLL